MNVGQLLPEATSLCSIKVNYSFQIGRGNLLSPTAATYVCTDGAWRFQRIVQSGRPAFSQNSTLSQSGLRMVENKHLFNRS